jgi:hypothetical protein
MSFLTFNRIHGVIFQKIELFIATGVRTTDDMFPQQKQTALS